MGNGRRGGKRVGAGRKRGSLKDIQTGALTAQKILERINDEKEIPELYRHLTAIQKLQTIFRLRDCAYGKPATSEEQQKPSGLAHVNVTIRRIGA
jgi:hypothetical protein